MTRLTKITIKKKCKCGRGIIVERLEHTPTPQPVCGYCRTYGLEKSIELKKSFQEQFKKEM